MAIISLGRFDVTIECHNGAGPTTTLSIGVASHQQVTVRNRTTLPYDVRTTCELPDPKPPRALSYPSAIAREVVDTPSLSGSGSGTGVVTLDVHGPAAVAQRIQVTDVEYRPWTSAVPPPLGGLWKKVSASALPATHAVDVV